MNNWWHVLFALVAIAAGLFVWVRFSFYDWQGLVAIVCLVCAFVLLNVCVCCTLEYQKEVQVYVQQKEYIEKYVADDSMENAALTQKIVELNEWLYTAQYNVRRYGGWSFYDESVLDLEPISRGGN